MSIFVYMRYRLATFVSLQQIQHTTKRMNVGTTINDRKLTEKKKLLLLSNIFYIHFREEKKTKPNSQIFHICACPLFKFMSICDVVSIFFFFIHWIAYEKCRIACILFCCMRAKHNDRKISLKNVHQWTDFSSNWNDKQQFQNNNAWRWMNGHECSQFGKVARNWSIQLNKFSLNWIAGLFIKFFFFASLRIWIAFDWFGEPNDYLFFSFFFSLFKNDKEINW